MALEGGPDLAARCELLPLQPQQLQASRQSHVAKHPERHQPQDHHLRGRAACDHESCKLKASMIGKPRNRALFCRDAAVTRRAHLHDLAGIPWDRKKRLQDNTGRVR